MIAGRVIVARAGDIENSISDINNFPWYIDNYGRYISIC